jgi:hypothetical protein
MIAMRTQRAFGGTVLGLALATLLLEGHNQARADVLYGATTPRNGQGSLYILNPATGGIVTTIGPLVDTTGDHFTITGLAFQPGTGVLYGATANGSPTDPRSLVTINPTTALVTPIGPFNAANGAPMGDIRFDPTTGKLYGANAVGGALYTIDLATGAATRISATDQAITTGSSGHGLAADATGTLFTTPDGAFGNLYTYDKNNGTATLITPLSGSPLDGAIGALSFDNGFLFGEVNSFGPPNDLITINTTTGAITDIGQTVDDLDAIAFQVTTTVPEPSTLALFALGGLALAGWQRWRKRSISE